MGKIRDFIKGVALPEQKTRQALALDAEFEAALADAQRLKAQILRLEAEVNPLKREVETLKDRVAQLTSSSTKDLVFDKATGTYTDLSTGDHYCTRCFSENKRSPLKDEVRGWHCMVCDTDYLDPARPAPVIGRTRPWGR